MELKDQVCSLELANKLYDLGIRDESLFYYGGHDGGEIQLFFCPNSSGQPTENHYDYEVPTFTVAELGAFLPTNFNTVKRFDGQFWVVEDRKEVCEMCGEYLLKLHDDFLGPTEADARAMCLIYLLENKLI